MSAKNSLKGYGYQVNVLNAFVSKMDLKRNIKSIESEAEVEHNFDDMVIIDENENILCFQVKNYEKFDINEVTIEDEVVKIVAGNTRTSNEFDPACINGLIVNKDFECDSKILGFKSKLIDGIHVIPLTENNYDEQVGEYINNSRKEFIQTQVINKISNAIFKFNFEELPKLSLFSNDLKHETVKFNKLPEIVNELSWHLGAPGTGKSHWAGEIDEFYENSILYRFYADEYNQERLKFDRFLEDFSHRIFGSPEKKSFEKTVEKLIEDDLIILIDGLDHVYNYNPLDLDKFLEFFDILKDTKTLIFSRPFPEIIEKDNVFNIENWNKKDTLKYLEHYGFEEDINEKIYELTNGYPIITYYLAEYYKKHKDLSNYSSKIGTINDYYKTILKDIRIKKPLDLFLFCNSYILESEIKELLYQNDAENLIEFIETYPFLFTRELNRLHLFHDSFFTYLREKSQMDYEYPIEKVKESILSKDINFLSRFKSFEFDDDFIKKVLKLYCNFDTFKELSKNFDFESIKIFYLSLKDILPNFKGVLDIYQYYSFILTTFIIERNDCHSEGKLFYNLFKYADRKGIDENQIFSNGVLWSLYIYYKKGDLYYYKKILEDTFYDKEDIINRLKMDWKEEQLWSLDYKDHLSDERFRQLIKEVPNREEFFEDYLAYIYIKDIKDSDYYTIISHYINNNLEDYHKEYYDDVCNELAITNFFKKIILDNTKIRIFERGLLEDENIFLKDNLENFMRSLSSKNSAEIYKYLVGYIRLYNHLNLDFNPEEIFKYFNMYFFRKDYTVMSLDDALLVFEKHSCLDECNSIKIINNTIKKSEKGIRGLLTSYLNQKDVDIISKLLNYLDDLEVQIAHLNPEMIDKIPSEKIYNDLKHIHSYTYFNDIKGILDSKYRDDLLSLFKSENIKVSDVPKDYESIFDEHSIQYKKLEGISDEKPFNERDYLVSGDLENIIENEISFLDLSTYLDGWHRCLPFVEFFSLYNAEDLKENCLDIIHNAISTKVRFSNEFFSIWYLCLGNIPILLDTINYDLDWNKLFKVLEDFLEQSGIFWR